MDGYKIFMSKNRIMIAGGGTGGHLFPALAIGEEILSRNPQAKNTLCRIGVWVRI